MAHGWFLPGGLPPRTVPAGWLLLPYAAATPRFFLTFRSSLEQAFSSFFQTRLLCASLWVCGSTPLLSCLLTCIAPVPGKVNTSSAVRFVLGTSWSSYHSASRTASSSHLSLSVPITTHFVVATASCALSVSPLLLSSTTWTFVVALGSKAGGGTTFALKAFLHAACVDIRPRFPASRTPSTNPPNGCHHLCAASNRKVVAELGQLGRTASRAVFLTISRRPKSCCTPPIVQITTPSAASVTAFLCLAFCRLLLVSFGSGDRLPKQKTKSCLRPTPIHVHSIVNHLPEIALIQTLVAPFMLPCPALGGTLHAFDQL